MTNELQRSKKTLEDRLGIGVEALSVPGGRWNRRVLKACTRAGYKRVYVSDPWMRPWECDGVEVLGRLMVRRTINAQELRQLVLAKGTAVLAFRIQYLAKETVKRLLGDRIYHRLWHFFAGSDERW